MTGTSDCPKCGARLPGDAPAGLCPRCLVEAGKESERGAEAATALPSRGASPRSGLGSRFEPPAVDELAPLFPQLEILELLGTGGMGAVYKARQPGLDRLVAVKILPREIGDDPAFAQRFTREAQAMAQLSHPHIVSVYDFGNTDGTFYIVMEYVDGPNLRQMIRAGKLQPEQALAIVPQICEALQYAHDEGIVHRDIKPENLLLDKKGRLKIADFGLSKLLREDRQEVSLTGTHQVMGTLRYMAPEQMQGSSAVDHRADIYSLGVVFYEMLTGQLPIGRFEPPSKKVQVDVRLDEVVLRSLESAPDRRYQHASDVKTDVESIVGASDTRLPPAKPVTVELESSVRRRLKIPAIGMLVAGIVNLLATLVVLLIPVLVKASGGFADGLEGFVEGSGTFAKAVFLSVIVAFLSLVSGIILVLGAARMFDLQSYPIALIAAVVAILPLAFGFPISLPFGIWALIVVLRRDVRTAFAGESEREQMMKESASAVGGTMVVGLTAGLAVGLALGTAMDNIPLYMTLGIALGFLFGWGIDINNRRKSKD